MKDLYVIGAGGLGRETIYTVINNNKSIWNIRGFIDDYVSVGTIVSNFNVVGDIDYLLTINDHIDVIVAIAKPNIRKEIVDRLSLKSNINFPNIVDHTAYKTDLIDFGKGNIILAQCILTINIVLEDFVILNAGCIVGHDAKLREFTTIYPGTNISGNVTINPYTEVGAGAVVIQGIEIGKNTKIGAGAVVINSIEDNVTAVGVPAKVVRKRKS